MTLLRPDPLEDLIAEAAKPMEYAGATEPAPKKPQAPPRKDEQRPTALPEMTVTASPLDETSYTVPNATTATKTDTPIGWSACGIRARNGKSCCATLRGRVRCTVPVPGFRVLAPGLAFLRHPNLRN
ncbi:MAG: hypothetical protein ACREU8_09520 [Gammaproteobacteria bacterium]